MQGPAAALDPQLLAASLQPQARVPLHSQLEATLRSLIQSGQIQPGAVVPGELDLAAQLGLSRHTIRHALGVLAAEGLLHRQRGRGTVVSVPPAPPPIERSLGTFYAFAWEVRARGAAQRSYVLERTPLPATGAMADRLGLTPGAPLERIVRLRTADGEPLVLETAYLPQGLAASLQPADLEIDSIYDALERYHGFRIAHARESIRPVVLSPSIARLLRLRAGAPAFAVERTTWSNRGPVEWQESIVRGDRYLYSVELPRQP